MNRLPIVLSSVLAVLSLFIPAAGLPHDPQPPTESPEQTSSIAGPDQSTGNGDSGWHFAISPYLWFTGVSGTVGVLGRDASVHASPGDILSNADVGLMGAVEIRKNRFVIPVDLMWAKLQANRATPFNPGISYVNVKLTQTIFTPGIGYRVIQRDTVNVDARLGIRYWHLGQNLTFQPSGILSNTSQSADWVDVVAGGKVEATPAPKVLVTVLGDAGGGGANLDYEIATLLGFKVSKKIVLQGGWRYLDIDYRTGPPFSFLYNVHQSGAIAGLTIVLK